MPDRITLLGMDDKDKVMLEKLCAMEDMIASLVPLLTKVVTQLEAQVATPAVSIATYEALYPPIEAGPPEGELVAQVRQQALPVGWWGRLFTQRGSDERP
jgi:hypothetical protein